METFVSAVFYIVRALFVFGFICGLALACVIGMVLSVK